MSPTLGGLLRRAAHVLRLGSADPPPTQPLSYEEIARQRAPKYRRSILFGQAGNDRVAAAIARSGPTMIARIGAVELTCLTFFIQQRQGRTKPPYPDVVVKQMATNAGFFPPTPEMLDRFAERFLQDIGACDVLAVWFNEFEDEICNRYAPAADLIELGCLEPFHHRQPWTRQLARKRVLVVHPFAESIRRQYDEKRRLLFTDPEVLPDFELRTLKAVQSIAGSPVAFTDWFAACDSMCAEMERIPFDVAIIGAGAYGLPLAAFAKKIGRQAVHMGGVTQILFGIKGRRWEDVYADSTAKLFNEHWVRPLESETPGDHRAVEGGCYW